MTKRKKLLRAIAGPAIIYADYRSSSIYNRWLKTHDPSVHELARQAADSRGLAYRPLISVVVPVYDPEDTHLTRMISSVKAQTYPNWELVLVDDASPRDATREVLKQSAREEARIRTKFLTKNRRISGATNQGIELASGDFIALLDNDDILRPNALFEVALALNGNRKLDFIYSDEDKITEADKRFQPFCKPDWNKDFLYSVNYITHFTVIRKSLLNRVGNEKSAYDGAQDWELFLRCTRSISADKIHHIPKILYSWRVHDKSTAKSVTAKPYVVEAQRGAIESDLQATGNTTAQVVLDVKRPGQWQVLFPTQKEKAEGRPSVCVVVQPGPKSKKVVRHVRNMTAYPCEVVAAEFTDALQTVQAEVVVFCNGELRIRDKNWLELLVRDALRRDIGLVQASVGSGAKALQNLQGMLSDSSLGLLAKMTRRNVSNHLYTTARYDLAVVRHGVVAVERKKLLSLPTSGLDSIAVVGERLQKKGLRHLYNPYAKVLR